MVDIQTTVSPAQDKPKFEFRFETRQSFGGDAKPGDNIFHVSVIETTLFKAQEKAKRMLGECPAPSWWALKVRSVLEIDK